MCKGFGEMASALLALSCLPPHGFNVAIFVFWSPPADWKKTLSFFVMFFDCVHVEGKACALAARSR